MTDTERAANRYAWQTTNDPNSAQALEMAFLAGAKWTEDKRNRSEDSE